MVQKCRKVNISRSWYIPKIMVALYLPQQLHLMTPYYQIGTIEVIRWFSISFTTPIAAQNSKTVSLLIYLRQ